MNNFVITECIPMRSFFYFILLFSIFSCKSEQDTETAAEEAEDTTAFQSNLKIEEDQLQLNDQAREYALNWVEFITAQNEINSLENYTVNEVINNAEAIAQIMQSLKASVPDSLKSVPVETRLNVVSTKAQLLRQYAKKQQPDAEDISEIAKELHQEFNNLKIQMNEIFLKTLEDFEKELDEFEAEEKESREKDTTGMAPF